MEGYRTGRLTARPTGKPTEPVSPGLTRLGLRTGRDGLIYTPRSLQQTQPTPLIISLHGAGGDAQNAVSYLQRQADRVGAVLLAPESVRSSWDIIRGGFGPDVEFVDKALQLTFRRYNIDPKRLSISGFSDGASYALTLGVTNGDLFSHILAFSPGFMRPGPLVGKPLIYISHGDQDAVLDIDYCSRRLVPALEKQGYDVTYREFHGPHTVPPSIADEAVDWFMKGKG